MKKTFSAFTMAEILISLTIIGVIAALTLPALMANLNEKVWNTQRKALHSRMAQALAAMPRLDGYQDTDEGSDAYNFVLNGLTTALNITKVCSKGKENKCDFPSPFLDVYDETWEDFHGVTFITVNGESIMIAGYNPSCTGSNNSDFLTASADNLYCVNFLYDLNGGSKGPNKFGKDMGFITAYFPEYPLVVAPMPVLAMNGNTDSATAELFAEQNSDYRLPTAAETYTLSWYLDSSNMWADNEVLCPHSGVPCEKTTEGDAMAILVSKNGSAAPNFETYSGCVGAHPTKPTNADDCWVCTNGEWELTCSR